MRRIYGFHATVLAASLGIAGHVQAADEIHWTITGSTSVSFDWRGPESAIQFGLTPAYGQTVAAVTPTPLPFSSSGPFWEAKLIGLLPDTLYHYSIGGASDHTFRTARAPGESDFTVYVEGDIGSTLTYWRVGSVQSLVAADRPHFNLMVGDLTYGNVHGPADIDQHFNDVMAWSQDAAYMPAWGNHEYENDYYADDLRNYKGRLDLPNAFTSPGVGASSCCGEDWYWFDYGNVRFIAYPEPTPGAWADWFPKADSLMDLAQMNKNITFIVTFGHRPAYSSGNHPGSPSLAGYLGQLGLTHNKYKLNLNGHSHDYERSYAQNGVIHITAGGGGASLEEQADTCRWKGGCPPPDWSAFRAYHHGPVKLSFGPSSIKVEAVCGPPGDAGSNVNDILCTPGSVFDSVTIKITTPESHIELPATDVKIDPGGSVQFAGSGSDPDGDLPLSYDWEFGGGAPNSTLKDPGPVVFNNAGIYRVRFTVIDSSGLADPTPDERTVVVGDLNVPPQGFILEPAGSMTIQEGQSIVFRGGASDADGDSSFTYAWDFDEGAPNVNVKDPGPVTFNTIGSFVVQLAVTDARGLADPTPAEVEITVADEAPQGEIVSPTADVAIDAGRSVDFQGTTFDPDGTLSYSYTWDFGGAAPSAHVEDPGPVVFATSGTYAVKFTVADQNGIADPTPATRLVIVRGTNQLPGAQLVVAPPTGNAPLATTASASGSIDPDGTIVSYAFDFGDGTVSRPDTSRVRSHTYAAGNYTARVTVTDNRGGASSTAVPVIVAPVAAGTDFVMNPSVETNLNGWAGYGGASLRRVPGGFDGNYAMELDGPGALTTFGLNDSPNWVAQTPASQVGLPYRFTAWVRSPHSTGRARIQAREFSGQTRIGSALSAYVPLTPGWQPVTVDYVVTQSGTTLDFQALDYPVAPAETLIVDNVSIKPVGASTAVNPLDGVTEFAAVMTPNPVRAGGAIHFVLPHPGFARVEVLDLSGRRVRSLLDRRDLGAGAERVWFDGRNQDGGRLASGVYFYRVETSFGTLTRRFAILR